MIESDLEMSTVEVLHQQVVSCMGVEAVIRGERNVQTDR